MAFEFLIEMSLSKWLIVIVVVAVLCGLLCCCCLLCGGRRDNRFKDSEYSDTSLQVSATHCEPQHSAATYYPSVSGASPAGAEGPYTAMTPRAHSANSSRPASVVYSSTAPPPSYDQVMHGNPVYYSPQGASHVAVPLPGLHGPVGPHGQVGPHGSVGPHGQVGPRGSIGPYGPVGPHGVQPSAPCATTYYLQ